MGIAQLAVVCCLFGLGNGVRLQLHREYTLDYYLFDNDSQIEFQLMGTRITGWMGIGVNNVSANMDGADIFIGGVDSIVGGDYGYDMHVPRGSGNGLPTNDTSQNWKLVHVNETDASTFMIVQRPLISPDKFQDIDILDTPINLIWAFNSVFDKLAEGHLTTLRGSVEVNLLVGSGGGVPTTNTPPTNTTPHSGAGIHESFSCSVFIGLFAAAKWFMVM